MKSGVVLISGRGSNMRSIVEARTGLEVKAVISNRPGAGGLEWAAAQGVEAFEIGSIVAREGDGPQTVVA